MKTIVPLLLSAVMPVFASTVSVTVTGITPQQAVLQIQASDNTDCTVQVSEKPDFSTVVNDVNTTLFPGSNECNRKGSIVRGNNYRMAIGFRGTASATGASSDKLIYSRSLQAYTTHYVKVTLASGATATATFTTLNPPLGNSAPDYIPYNVNGYGNYGWPSQHFANLLQVDSTIDPLTGFQMNRITGPGMAGNGTSNTDPVYIVSDNSHGGWTLNCRDASNSYNIYKNAQSTNYCTYTGAGGQANALFIEFNWKGRGLDMNGGNDGDALPGGILYIASDLQLTLNALGDNLQACFTLDGSTCIGSTPVTIANQSTDTTQSFPSTWPEVQFKDWNSPALHADYTLTFSGTTTNSGTSVTITDNGQAALMPYWAKPGMWVEMTDNANYYDFFQIASIADARHFTFSGTIPSGHTYTNYTLQSYGLLVWKATGGTGTVKLGSMHTLWAYDADFFNGYEGGGSVCGAEITVNNDAAGNPISPIQAKMCGGYNARDGVASLGWFWSPTNGEVRVYDIASSPRNLGWNYNGSTGQLSLCSYDNSYLGVPYSSGTSSNPHVTCSIPNTTYTVMQEIKAAHPEIDLNYWTNGGANNAINLRGEKDYNGHSYALFVADNGEQNVAWWEFVLDLSLPPGAGQVIAAHNSWSSLPIRFGTTHYQNGPNVSGDYFNGSSHNASLISMGGPNTGGVGAGTAMVGQYGMTVTNVANNASGAVASTYAESCSADGVTDASVISQEPSDNSCYQVTVSSEPVNHAPPTGSWAGYANGDLTPFASQSLVGSRPGPWKHNATTCPGGAGDNTTSHCYSYLVDSALGDWLIVATLGSPGNGNWADDHSAGNEIDLIAKKTMNGDGTINLVLVRAPKNSFGSANPNALMNIPAGFVLDEVIPGQIGDGFFPLALPFTAANFEPNSPIFTAHTDQWVTPDGREISVSTNDYRQYIRTMGESFATHQARVGALPGVLTQSWTNSTAEYHPFDPMPNPSSSYYGNSPGLGINAPSQYYTQYHPGGNPTSADANESNIAFDASPFGTAQGGSDTLWTHTYTLVSGQSHTYAISDPNMTGQDGYGTVITSALDPKRRETMAFAGTFLLHNISSPFSLISDSTPYSYCRAFKAGQCVSGSTAGQSYVSVPDADLDGSCKINLTMATPCFSPVDPHHSYVYQFSIKGNDPFGVNWRRITMGYGGPTRNANYWNAHGDPTGKYVYVEGDVLDGIRTDILAVKLPPYPQLDGIRRDIFMNIPVQLAALSGNVANTARIRFGYAEYGYDSNNQPLFCSSEYADDCSTGTPPVATDPYAWEDENPTWQDCTNGCTVKVPSISGRILYYVVDRNVGGTVTSSPLQMIAIQ